MILTEIKPQVVDGGREGARSKTPPTTPSKTAAKGKLLGVKVLVLLHSESVAIPDVFEISTKFARNYLLIFQFQGADARRLFDPLPSSGTQDVMLLVAPLDYL